MDENYLIVSAKKGDLSAFNTLILHYQDTGYRIAYHILGDPAAAEDALQDAFISAYNKLYTFREGSFKAWLFRIIRNACLDELRRQKRRPQISLEPLNDQDEEIESPTWLTDPTESPEQRLIRTQMLEAIQTCLQELSEEFREVVVMVDIQGMDYTEASSVIGTPLGTIKSRIARARKKMQSCLQGFGELLPSSFRSGYEEQS